MKRRIVTVLFVAIVMSLLVLSGCLLTNPKSDDPPEKPADRIVLTDMNDADGWNLGGKEGVVATTEVGDGVVTFRFQFGSGEYYAAIRDFTVDLDQYPIIEMKLNEVKATGGGGWVQLQLGAYDPDQKSLIMLDNGNEKGNPVEQVDPQGTFRINVKEYYGLTGTRNIRVWIGLFGSGDSWVTVDHVHALDSTYSANIPL